MDGELSVLRPFLLLIVCILMHFITKLFFFQKQLICTLLGQMDANIFPDNLRALVAERVGNDSQLAGIEALGLLTDDPVVKCVTPLDTLSHYLSKRLALREYASDCV